MRRTSASVTLLWVLPFTGCGWQPNTELDPPEVAGPVGSTLKDEAAGADKPMGSVYQERLEIWRDRQRARRESRIHLEEEELIWRSTAYDPRVALLVSTETGFDTWGIETSIAEIPARWHTGRHRHGEEAIYVLAGEGFIEVGGVRYDIETGTTVGVPFGAEHRMYNTGDNALRYLSATAFPLERYLGLYRLEQSDTCGPTGELPQLPVSTSGFDAQGRRIRLFWKDALYRDGSIGLRVRLEALLRAGLDLGSKRAGDTPYARNRAAHLASGLGHHSGWVRLMGGVGQRDFANRLALISGVLIDGTGSRSGRHAHMEAVLYVLQGSGESVIDGEKVTWKTGSSLHIQGPQTWHQHFNTGDEPAYLLRVASGLRPYLEETVGEVYPFLWAEAQGRIDGTGGG